jgi:hypothetical protein
MSSALKYMTGIKSTGLFVASILFTLLTQAQDYDSIAAKYKGQHAVITNYTRRMVIKKEDSGLVANSYVTIEKLLISDRAANLYNHDYVSHSTFNKVADIDAFVSLPTKTGYRKIPCNTFSTVNPDRDEVFYDDSREIVVSYSGLVKNAVTEVKYVVEHSDLNMLLPFSFQRDIPIVKATFEIVAPQYVNISFVLKGEHTNWIKQEKEEKNHVVTYRFTATDIPAFKTFDDVPSASYYMPHIVPYITSYKLPDARQTVEMLSSPAGLYRSMYKYVRNLNMKPDTLINHTVKDLTADDRSAKEKAAHIYNWVQNNLHYVAFEAGMEGFVPREAGTIVKRKYGDCKDMTSVLVTMCRKAGLDAYFAWVGTRGKPYILEETPVPFAFDHMICAVKIGDDWLFMDGTHPLIPFGEIPEGIQGKQAMIAIDRNNYKIVTIPVTAAEKNTAVDSTILTFADRKVSGSLCLHYKGYRALGIAAIRMYNKAEDRDKAITKLTQRGSDKYHQERYNIVANGSNDMTIYAGFDVEDYVHHAGKQYFFNMNLIRRYSDNHIDLTDRTVPYYYPFKETTKEVVVLEIPKGFKVASLPKPTKGSVDGMWNYTISYKADAKTVVLTKEYTINTLSANVKQVADNNKMATGLDNIYRESVVLTAK